MSLCIRRKNPSDSVYAALHGTAKYCNADQWYNRHTVLVIHLCMNTLMHRNAFQGLYSSHAYSQMLDSPECSKMNFSRNNPIQHLWNRCYIRFNGAWRMLETNHPCCYCTMLKPTWDMEMPCDCHISAPICDRCQCRYSCQHAVPNNEIGNSVGFSPLYPCADIYCISLKRFFSRFSSYSTCVLDKHAKYHPLSSMQFHCFARIFAF